MGGKPHQRVGNTGQSALFNGVRDRWAGLARETDSSESCTARWLCFAGGVEPIKTHGMLASKLRKVHSALCPRLRPNVDYRAKPQASALQRSSAV